MCHKHGATLPNVKAARDRRLQRMADRALDEMFAMATSGPITKTKQAAACDILDRAGVGAIAQAKVRSSFHGNNAEPVTVQIGFLDYVKSSDEPVIDAVALPEPAGMTDTPDD
jgi:hypothetical protein